MKRINILILFIVATSLFTGCSLDEPTYGKTSSENFYQKESDIDYALTGAYLQLRKTWEEFSRDQLALGDCTTDDAWKGGGSQGDWGEYYDLEAFNVYTTNAVAERYWKILYNVINRANDVIFYAPSAQGNAEKLSRYAKEAKALRGMAYYYLWSNYGEVPLLVKPNTPMEVINTPRSSLEDVFSRIEKDLQDASTLPRQQDYTKADTYRATRGFAKAFLAKAYMFKGDFMNAETVLNDIVNVDNDYSLMADYGAIWRTELESGNTESIWEIPNKMYDKTVATGTNVPHFFTNRSAPSGGGYGFHCPTQDLLDAYDDDDPRQTYVAIHPGDQFVGESAPHGAAQAPDGYHDAKVYVPGPEKVGFDVWLVSYNFRMLRYADILLMYAETLNENGKSSLALAPLKQVRDRARATKPKDPRRSIQVYIPATNENSLPEITTTDKAELKELIWKERRLEMSMEGWRRDDLLRQKRFGSIVRSFATTYDSYKGKGFKDNKDYRLPIPQGERDKTNNILSQNDGYN